MSTARWMQSLVKTRPDLYRAIYDWNAYPHRWALPAWLDVISVPAPVVALLEKTTRGRQRLSQSFRRALRLHEELWDFQSPRRRLALLPPATLERLARFAGATVLAPAIARIITRDERRSLTDRIGEDAYLFALRRGRLLTPTPELSAFLQRDGDLHASVEHAGWRLLAACVEDESPALRLRFRLKTPRAVTLPAGGEAAPHRDAAWALVEPIVRETLSREELRCFA